jgi:hypothetical protein
MKSYLAKHHKTFLAIGVVVFIVLLGLAPIDNKTNAKDFHSSAELTYYKSHGVNLKTMDIDTNYFPTSNRCSGCHGTDPNNFGQVDANGVDVNIHDDWRSTMMANSAKDPFWRAKVSHEVLTNPSHADAIETTCTTCHAPMGHYNAMYNGATHYTISDMISDTLGIDGVSCAACHQMAPDSLGVLHTGNLKYDTTGVIYGPYEDVFQGPMGLYVGVEPILGEHINDAGLCASCHTLIVESVDLEGNSTGTTLVEQATYHEWLNSKYNLLNVTCQECHMPRLDDSIVIATGYANLEKRFPYGLHELAGANTFMLGLMKDNREILGIDAEAIQFDSTMAATLRMLQQKTLDSELQLDMIDNDTAYFSLSLTNKAGHKFPSGYPSRIAFVEFRVKDDEGNTLFHSGKISNNQVENIDPNFEPHFNIITQEEEVQVYEVVNGDVNGNFTTVLERGYQALKDNRLPPMGFVKSHSTYDTVRIVGAADIDPDFNIEQDPDGGNGIDIVHYHIPLGGFSGLLNVTAKVHYQSLPPRWMEEMFQESTPEIELFEDMYDIASGKSVTTVLISEDKLEDILVENTSINEIATEQNIKIFPNPSTDGRVTITNKSEEIEKIRLLSYEGKILGMYPIQNNIGEIWLPNVRGVYYLEIFIAKGKTTKKVVRE